MSNRNSKYTILGLLTALFFVGGALIYTNSSKFALIPNDNGIYKSKITLALQKIGIIKAEALASQPSCDSRYEICDAIDGGSGEAGACGPYDYTCDAGSVGSETATSWICYGTNGDDAFCYVPAANAVCGATHYNCTVGTEFPAYRYYGSSGIAGNNMYSWKCVGVNGGIDATCEEHFPANGSCNTSTAYSCNVGTSINNVSNPTTYTWQCSGLWGGTTASCTMNKPLPGQCYVYGGANACSTGSAFNTSSDATTYYWYCSGVNGGASSPQCSKAKVIGQCNSTGCDVGTYTEIQNDSNARVWYCNGADGASATCPTEYKSGACDLTAYNKCGRGAVQNTIVNSTTWDWQCGPAVAGGSTASCSLPRPVCGAAINACASGTLFDTADDASNNNWQCNVAHSGGVYTNCSIAKTNGSCGSTVNACNAGSLNDTADDATYSKWQCAGINNGTTASCQLAKVNGQCNTTINVLNACTAGTFQDNTDSTDYVQWYCNGANGGTNMGCAKQIMKGACGGTINSCVTKPITPGLTADGGGYFVDTADDASNNNWRCDGVNSGPSANCSIAKINGACGGAVNSCTTGSLNDTADDAANKNWQCVGANNGTTANCSIVQPPVVSLSLNTTNGGTSGRAYYYEAGTLNWTATNNPANCYVYKNGSVVANLAGNATTYTTEGLLEGNTVYNVMCRNAGGDGFGSSVTFIVPTAPTSLSATCANPGGTGNFSWTLPSGYTGTYFRYCKGTTCDYTTACAGGLTPPNGSCVNGTYSSIAQATTPGSTYAWYIHTMDGYGNWSSAVSGSNVYCTPAAPNTPSIGNSTPANLGIGMNGTFVISATDSIGNNVRYQIDSDNNGTTDFTTGFSSSGWSYSWVNNWGGSGSKTFQVRTESSDGRLSAWVPKTVNIIAAAVPSISYTPGDSTYNQAVTVNWSSTGASSCSVTKNGSAWQTGLSGSVSSGALTVDTTFGISCTNAAGQTATASTYKGIFPVLFPNNNSTYVCGGTYNVFWTSGNAASCSIKKDGAAWMTGTSNAGIAVGPQTTAQMVFDWSCTSPSGLIGTGAMYVPTNALNGACNATKDLCTAGDYADVVDNASQYLWNCTGRCAGTTANCSALKPPLAPTISGPVDGGKSVSYNFTISGTDPSGQQVKYGIDWDNNGTVDFTTSLGNSGWNYTATNNWGGGGVKNFKAQTITSDGRTSGWSTVYAINIHDVPGVTINTSSAYADYNSANYTISWSSTDATSCSVTKNGSAWQSGTSGSVILTDFLTSDMTFVANCTNVAGNNSSTAYIYIRPFMSIGMSPTTVNYNNASTISWNSSYAQSCNITKAGAAWQAGLNNAGISSGPLTSNTQFVISCLSTTGKASNSATTTVNVNPLNGACSATHYTCNAGTSANNVNGAMVWTWNCNGANGGSNASCSENKPLPNAPAITGPTEGKINTNYTFGITATNPAGDPIRYAIDWDNNGSVDGYLPVSGTTTSGTTLNWTNQWAGNGVKTFKVRTETNGGPISGWTSYSITMYGLPDVIWNPTNGNMAYGDRLTLGYAATDASYCNLYSTVAGDPNTYEAAPFWSSAPASYTWTNVGPYYQSFKRKAVCYNPFGDYKSVEFVGTVTQNDATCFDMAISNFMVPNETFSPTITLSNTGTNAWRSIAPNLHNVFVGQSDWGTNRYLPLTNAPVNPGSQGIFKGGAGVLKAPSTEGYYDFSVRGVQALESGESFYGATCTPVTVHPGNKILVKAPTLGIGDTDVDIDAVSFPAGYVVDDPAITRNITVRNRGGGTINGSISIPAGKFACTSGCTFVLGPGGTSSVTVSFQSNASGTFATTMAVNSDAGNKNVTLSASTGAKFTIKNSPLDFGQVPIGKSRYLDLKITNNSLSQASGAFAISPSAPMSCISGCASADLNPNTTRTIRLKFTPSSTSTINQTLNLPTVPSISVILNGQGIVPVFKIEEK